MLTLIILGFLLFIFFLTPLLWLACGKLLKVQNLTLKKSFITYILTLLAGVVLQIITVLIYLLGFTHVISNLISFVAALIIVIWIIKSRFETTIPRSIGIYLSSIIFSVCLALFIRTYVVQAFKIPSGAMEPSILVGDHILANKFIYNFTEPERGDIIIFEYPVDPTKVFVKRIVGFGGDKIEVANKQVYINDKALKESYAVFKAGDDSMFPLTQKGRNFGPFTVPEGQFFVMGDNRDNSHDSRYWGPVTKEAIKGRASLIYWSWDRKSKRGRWDRIGIEF